MNTGVLRETSRTDRQTDTGIQRDTSIKTSRQAR